MYCKTTIDDDDSKRTQIFDENNKITCNKQNDKTRIHRKKFIPVRNSEFYLPYFENDLIQNSIFKTGNYFDQVILDFLSMYLNQNSVVVDIGANIGNHSLYFANECNVRKIYAFEPVPETYKILAKNIKINNLTDRVEAYKLGLSDKITKGEIFNYNPDNMGGTCIKPTQKGKIKLVTLDSLNIQEKIDFIKIDVEGMDYQVLCGATETIKKYKPVINIESFPTERAKSNKLLQKLGYKIVKEFNDCEFVYTPKPEVPRKNLKIHTTTVLDKNNNRIVKVFQNNLLVSEQVTPTNPVSDIPITQQENKIIKVKNSTFFLPNSEEDLIQGFISNGNYFDEYHLKKMSEYLNPSSVVLDIGANIGNHSLYFANECNVKKVYAFEPVPYTFNILKKNIELNHLEKRVIIRQAGVSNIVTGGAIKGYDTKNLGGTRMQNLPEGEIPFITLDSINFEEKIDFIKIDVEGMDFAVLSGAINTIKKYKPIIEMESFDSERVYSEPFLLRLGYKLERDLGSFEYIYVPV